MRGQAGVEEQECPRSPGSLTRAGHLPHLDLRIPVGALTLRVPSGGRSRFCCPDRGHQRALRCGHRMALPGRASRWPRLGLGPWPRPASPGRGAVGKGLGGAL